jgi:hypothetical protein
VPVFLIAVINVVMMASSDIPAIGPDFNQKLFFPQEFKSQKI